MTPARIRVLVVDDSAFARKVVREILTSDRRIEVVGIARDGLEALEKVAMLEPDVITLDLVMSSLDGVGVLRALPREGRPEVVVVSFSDVDSELGIEALQLGAFDLVHKPTAMATARLYELGADLIRKVIAAAEARQTRHDRPPAPEPASPALLLPAGPGRYQAVVVGTSTGGPQALTRLLTALPADFPVPLAIALHIPAGYTQSLAKRLDDCCAISVAEAAEGSEMRPGLALIAPGGSHMRLHRRAGGGDTVVTGLESNVNRLPYVPSVDVLFESAARAFEGRVLGVIMTGMGEDGLSGSRAIHAAGGLILAEAASSAVVYGMPRVVWEAGLAVARVPLDRLAEAVRRILSGPGGAPVRDPVST